MQDRKILIGFLNIVATPHPEGAYVKALTDIAAKPVRYRGKDFAVVFRPDVDPSDDRYLRGRVSAWTDIDASEPAIDKSTFEQVDVESDLQKIFLQRGFNNRTFNYVFDVNKHHLAVELVNELNQRISILQIKRIFESLLSSLNREGQTYEVTVIPSKDALDSVLGLERIDKIEIVLKRDNVGDHDDGDADDVLRELEEQNTKRQTYTFARQPGTDGIHLNKKNRARAEAAQENGSVTATGIDRDGERQSLSTENYPDIVSTVVAAGGSILNAIKEKLARRSSE
jgi:hypothetical protein